MVVVTEATEVTGEETAEDDWALARTAKAPATRKLVKRILRCLQVVRNGNLVMMVGSI